MQIETVPIKRLKPHPKNVRQGDVGAISESLKAHGQYKPLVVQRGTEHILAGNHTWRAARKLGWTEIAVTYADVDDDEALRILLVDNRTTDLATYDDHALMELLTILNTTDDGLDGTGFDGDDLDNLLADLGAVLGAGTVDDREPRESDNSVGGVCPTCGQVR